MTEPRIYMLEERFCIAFWNNVVLSDALVEIDALRMRKLGEAYAQLLTTYPHVVGLCLLRQGTPVSSTSARAEAARFGKIFGDTLAHVAMVTEDTGVVAQLFRSIIRGFNVLTRNSRLTIHEDLGSAMSRVLPLTLTSNQRPATSAELMSAITSTREQLLADPSPSATAPPR